ncbi:MAG: hypothetical protein AB8D78_06195 [Akkermansiaceae bacterium]
MMILLRFLSIVGISLNLAHGKENPHTSLTAERALAGFEKRVDEMFRAQAGKPLHRAKKKPPLKKGRPPYIRAYSHSMMAFAARCLYLNEKIEEANAALVENAEAYLEDPESVSDRDSFHWHGEMVLRLLEFYGPKGSVSPGLITGETEKIILQPHWHYSRLCSKLERAEYKKSQTWHLYSTENHHTMDFTLHWHFAKYVKDHPDYKDRVYNGAKAAEHYAAWNDYFLHYCLQRARYGICTEMRSDGYNATWAKGLVNFYDFGDTRAKKAAKMLLDLYLAYWAEEQIKGHMGGGAARVRGFNYTHQKRNHGNAQLAWMYFGIGEPQVISGHYIGYMLSKYRPPALIADLALDEAGRGKYEITQRAQGLGQNSNGSSWMHQITPHLFRTDGGGNLRYSYCDPEFIIGCVMSEARPLEDWVRLNVQSRWQGVIFNGEYDPRIVPIVKAKNNRDTQNASWCVQKKGSLIVHQLKDALGAEGIMVWMSKKGLSDPVEEDGIVFVEAPGAYASFRAAWGDYSFEKKQFGTQPKLTPPGFVLIPANPLTPVILEVMAKADVENFEEFKKRVKAATVSRSGAVLTYQSIYGDLLTLDTSYSGNPTINGQAIDYQPERVFNSPFIISDYKSGVMRIRKGREEIVHDFNTLLKPK